MFFIETLPFWLGFVCKSSSWDLIGFVVDSCLITRVCPATSGSRLRFVMEVLYNDIQSLAFLQDMLISLKLLIFQRAKTIGYADLAKKFNLKIIRAIGMTLLLKIMLFCILICVLFLDYACSFPMLLLSWFIYLLFLVPSFYIIHTVYLSWGRIQVFLLYFALLLCFSFGKQKKKYRKRKKHICRVGLCVASFKGLAQIFLSMSVCNRNWLS